uniref:Uncharacterized protein n=1 Tax=Picea glauca TaxID=3330 RepID=A0A101M039_PICGL|nr:hypothetical protein ABT39_MTgene4535 [Picea glauca]QHR91205.1 hypothetical protein Q903MT_gene5237 [Picea sitchensis]
MIVNTYGLHHPWRPRTPLSSALITLVHFVGNMAITHTISPPSQSFVYSVLPNNSSLHEPPLDSEPVVTPPITNHSLNTMTSSSHVQVMWRLRSI